MSQIFGNISISQEIYTINQRQTNLATLEQDFITRFRIKQLAQDLNLNNNSQMINGQCYIMEQKDAI